MPRKAVIDRYLTISLPPDTKEEFINFCQREGYSYSRVGRNLIQDWLAAKTKAARKVA
jgi:hypothetical protein